MVVFTQRFERDDEALRVGFPICDDVAVLDFDQLEVGAAAVIGRQDPFLVGVANSRTTQERDHYECKLVDVCLLLARYGCSG